MNETQPQTEPLAVQFEDGAHGHTLGYEKTLLTVSAERAYPPGRPLSLSVLVAGAPVPLTGRCIGSKRMPSGEYEVRMRLTNLTRTTRSLLEGHFV